MKTVLCYGDSNTYGYSPIDGSRFDKSVRWTGILKEMLEENFKDEYELLEEGCNGRTTIFDDPYEEWKNGLTYLKPCLNSHKPVDIFVMMLGTNDLKKYFGVSAKEIAAGAEKLVKEVKDFSTQKNVKIPKIILVSPPYIGEGICESCFKSDFDERSLEESKQFAIYYEKVANENGCIFLDAAKIVRPSDEDSLHLMPEEHRKMAEKMYEVIVSCVE